MSKHRRFMDEIEGGTVRTGLVVVRRSTRQRDNIGLLPGEVGAFPAHGPSTTAAADDVEDQLGGSICRDVGGQGLARQDAAEVGA
jgi:hypothetical protein